MLTGCIGNCYVLEEIAVHNRNYGIELTGLQFLFNAVVTYYFAGELKHHKKVALMALLFWLANVLTNYSFNYQVSITIGALIKSSNLIMTELLNVYLKKKPFSAKRLGACGLITTGLLVLLLSKSHSGQYSDWRGISFLLVGVAFGLWLTQLQGDLSKSMSWITLMFWSNAMALPLFLLVSKVPDITPGLMFISSISQAVCIVGVNLLFTKYSSTTVIALMTIRKVITIIISTIWYPTIPVTNVVLATALVIGGGLIY